MRTEVGNGRLPAAQPASAAAICNSCVACRSVSGRSAESAILCTYIVHTYTPHAGSGAGGSELTPRGTLHLQQLLLEGIANGSVREGADVGRLVCSTFAAQQQVRWHNSCQPCMLVQVASQEVFAERTPRVGFLHLLLSLQGIAMMQQGSKAALRSLMEEKKLVKWSKDQVRAPNLTFCVQDGG